MKKLSLLILSLLIALSSSETCYTDPTESDGEDVLDDCDKMQLGSGIHKCCLLDYKYQGTSGKSCFSLTKDEYDNRNKAIEKLKTNFPGSEGTIECKGDNKSSSSSLLKISKSLFSLLLILI